MLYMTNLIPRTEIIPPSCDCKIKCFAKLSSTAIRIALWIISLSICLLGAPVQANQNTPDPLSLIKGLTATQINTLHNAGIESLSALSISKPELIAKTLKVDKKQASTLINQAALERTKLGRTLVSARNRFKLPTIALPGSYASLVTPTNECTLLVRKVCGLENQCSTSTGCQPSITLLERYNSASTDLDRVHVAESCLMAMQDEVLFWQCAP